MEKSNKYILCKLQEQSFAVDVNQVISIERIKDITNVPRAARFIKGITVIRDETTPIIDLRERLLMKETAYTNSSRILVVQINGMQIGLIVDAATEVIDIEEELIKPAPSLVGGVNETFINGVVKYENALLIIIELDAILSARETMELQEVIES